MKSKHYGGNISIVKKKKERLSAGVGESLTGNYLNWYFQKEKILIWTVGGGRKKYEKKMTWITG